MAWQAQAAEAGITKEFATTEKVAAVRSELLAI
jgi:hypothetical protein